MRQLLEIHVENSLRCITFRCLKNFSSSCFKWELGTLFLQCFYTIAPKLFKRSNFRPKYSHVFDMIIHIEYKYN